MNLRGCLAAQTIERLFEFADPVVRNTGGRRACPRVHFNGGVCKRDKPRSPMNVSVHPIALFDKHRFRNAGYCIRCDVGLKQPVVG